MKGDFVAKLLRAFETSHMGYEIGLAFLDTHCRIEINNIVNINTVVE